MGLFAKFKAGLQKTHAKLTHEIKRIVTRSPKLNAESLEELEAALIAADLGMAMTTQIVAAVKKAYETQGGAGLDVFAIAPREIENSLSANKPELHRAPHGPTVVSIVGVNGTGKTTTAAKLAHLHPGPRRNRRCWPRATPSAPPPSSSSSSGGSASRWRSSPAPTARIPPPWRTTPSPPRRRARRDYLFIDTAGRLHTKHNLMQELQKLHRVMGKQLPGAPHEVLLVLDATTGMNALNQAREFNKAVPLTGLIVTKLDGTSKGGMVVAIQKELGLPIKFIGLGEQPDDLQPFDARQFAEALFKD